MGRAQVIAVSVPCERKRSNTPSGLMELGMMLSRIERRYLTTSEVNNLHFVAPGQRVFFLLVKKHATPLRCTCRQGRTFENRITFESLERLSYLELRSVIRCRYPLKTVAHDLGKEDLWYRGYRPGCLRTRP